jgi:hypothetical protein
LSDRQITFQLDVQQEELERQRDLVLMFKECMEDEEAGPVDEEDFRSINQLLAQLDEMIMQSYDHFDTYAGALEFAES